MPAAYWYIDRADINVWLPLQPKFEFEEKFGWFKLDLGPEAGFLPVGRALLILSVSRLMTEFCLMFSFVWSLIGVMSCSHQKDKKTRLGRVSCGAGQWGGLTRKKKKKAKVTAPRQCFLGPIKWSIHGFRTTSLWSQGDTPIEWGPGWPSLFVPSWPLLSRMASAPLTWPVPVHQ